MKDYVETTMTLLAQAAIANGVTRGRFIRENTAVGDSFSVLQAWSDAYSAAMGIKPAGGTRMRNK